MDTLSLFGLFAILFMLLCYMMEERSPWWTLGFAAGCVLSSVYGFLQGAWPFGAVEILWTLIALRRWWLARGRQRADAGAIDAAADRRAAQGEPVA